MVSEHEDDHYRDVGHLLRGGRLRADRPASSVACRERRAIVAVTLTVSAPSSSALPSMTDYHESSSGPDLSWHPLLRLL